MSCSLTAKRLKGKEEDIRIFLDIQKAYDIDWCNGLWLKGILRN